MVSASSNPGFISAAAQIADGIITGAKLVAGTVTGDRLNANVVDGTTTQLIASQIAQKSSAQVSALASTFTTTSASLVSTGITITGVSTTPFCRLVGLLPFGTTSVAQVANVALNVSAGTADYVWRFTSTLFRNANIVTSGNALGNWQDNSLHGYYQGTGILTVQASIAGGATFSMEVGSALYLVWS